MTHPTVEQQRWNRLEQQVKKMYTKYNLSLFNWENAPKGVSFRNFTIQIEDQLQIDRFEFQWQLVFDCFTGKLRTATVDGSRVEDVRQLISGDLEVGANTSRILHLTESTMEQLHTTVGQEFAPTPTLTLVAS